MKKFYPLFPLSILGWIIPFAVCMALIVLIALFGETTSIGMAIGIISPLAIAAICACAFFFQISSRVDVISKVVEFRDFGQGKHHWPIAFRIEPGAEGAHGLIKELIEDNVLLHIDHKFSRCSWQVRNDCWMPIVFVTYQKPGTIKVELGKVTKRARGLQTGHWCQVEWGKGKERELTIHELAHVALTESYPRMTTDEQHKVIESALGV